MRSLWETMLSRWLGRPHELAIVDAPEIVIAVRRESAVRADTSPALRARSPRDLASAIGDIEGDRALG
jgi:hypothetical protein